LSERVNYSNYTGNNYIQSTKNLNYPYDKTFSDNFNMNNSSSIIVTSDVEYNLNKTTLSNNNYKNSEKSYEKEINYLESGVKSSNKSSYKRKLNLKLNNKQLLKKSNNKKIFINISSIQSPDHRAIYKIEKNENHENGEIKYEKFKNFNKPKTENKKLFELQQCTSANIDINSSKPVNLYDEKNEKLKVKKLVFDDYDDCVSNNHIKKDFNINNINNNLNDRIQRAISNSPNRIRTENSSNKNNDNLVRDVNSSKNRTKETTNSQISKISKDSFNFDNDNNQSYNKIMVNSTMNFYIKPEQNISNYFLPIKNKTIDHEEETEINYMLNNKYANQKKEFLCDRNRKIDIDIKNPYFNLPINRKSKLRLNSFDISVGRMYKNDKDIIPVTENKNDYNKNYINYDNPKLNFLKERYGDKKLNMLIDLLKNSDDVNKTINDNEKIKSIVGEDFRIAKSFLKTISNEIFSKE
jgi:hypothetical protein